jgi:GR25 family glycosyltransferase involved in LPS biosynthesis
MEHYLFLGYSKENSMYKPKRLLTIISALPLSTTKQQNEKKKQEKAVWINKRSSHAGQDRIITVSGVPGIPWIDTRALPKTYVISMDPRRYQGLELRLKDWSKNVTHWPATNGNFIKRQEWINKGFISRENTMTRGELGVYDSHRRIWDNVQKLQLPVALVLEDDADLRYSEQTTNVIRSVLDKCAEFKFEWDIIYLGHNNNYEPEMITGEIGLPFHCQGLFTYLVSLNGARKLMNLTKPPILKPIDVTLGDLADESKLVALSLEPRLCYVVAVSSSTVSIK